MKGEIVVPAASTVFVHPFIGFDIPHLVRLQANRRGAHPFLIWRPFDADSRIWTYAQFADAIGRVAQGLTRRGVRKGDRVVVHLENCPESVLAWFACAHLGAMAIMTNARAAGPELSYFVKHSRAVGLITQPRLLRTAQSACENLVWIIVTEADNGAAPAAGHKPEAEQCFSTLLRGTEVAPLRTPDPDLAIGVQYTSGTTSRPKGVVMTHANALWAARIGSTHIALREDDRYLIHLPLYHVIALSYSLLATLWAGATAVLLPRFSASRFWSISLEQRCTWTSMVPFCVRALGDQDVPKAHSYRAWGNAVWSQALERKFNVAIVGWWGMTEIITHGIIGDPGKPGRPGAIGRPAPEYQLAVRDEAGDRVGPGQKGHLSIRGTPGLSLFAAYLDDPGATEASFDSEGFFLTGDLVTLHTDGFIEFADRAKDMLKVGGENVAASEVEAVIMRVAGVREAAVVGRKDAMLGEVAVAFVRLFDPKAPTDQLHTKILTLCGENLAGFKVPRAIHFVDDLPRGTIEKVSKIELRERANRLVIT